MIAIIIVSHLIGGPSLHVLAGVGATIKKRHRHRTKIAQTKKESPGQGLKPDRGLQAVVRKLLRRIPPLLNSN